MIASYRKTLVVIGATLVSSPLSFIAYYGNLLPYIASYNYAHRYDVSFLVDPLWPASVFACAFIFSMVFTSPIELRFGIRPCILAADIMLWGSLLSGYFTIKEPLAFMFIYGGLQGVALGVLYSLSLKIVLETTHKQRGASTGVMSVGMVFGTLVSIGVSYAVVNPSNKKPDLKVDNNLYFSDKDLIDKIPIYFLAAGAIFVVFTLCGTLLVILECSDIFDNRENQRIDTPLFNHSKKYSDLNSTDNYVSTDKLKGSTPLYGKNSQNQCNLQENNVEIETGGISSSNFEALLSSNDRADSTKERQEYAGLTSLPDLSPMEIVKTAKFWCVWLGYVSSHHTNYIHLNLYKAYGVHAIPNDAILVATGLVSNAGVIIVSVLLGIASDKFEVRTVNVAVNLASCLFMSLMVVVLHTCPWMYMVTVIIENLVIFPHTMLFSLITASEFGNTHCASNMGLIRTGNLLLPILEPFLVDNLVKYIGWDWVFLSGSFTSAIAGVAVMGLYWL